MKGSSRGTDLRMHNPTPRGSRTKVTVGSTGQYRFLVHEATSKYINGSSVNGAALTNRSGYNPYAGLICQLDNAGGGAVRLRNNSTGKCIYGTNTNGGTVHSWTCWGDPGMA